MRIDFVIDGGVMHSYDITDEYNVLVCGTGYPEIFYIEHKMPSNDNSLKFMNEAINGLSNYIVIIVDGNTHMSYTINTYQYKLYNIGNQFFEKVIFFGTPIIE